ncbi:tryptophan halogenase PrnA [Asticcacaulis biprosthecium C19]|uniref:Tryptophan halogenase PrnA n=1 Tax=Asticcacaulis biprosthecium C19 TaxID=715226 RepID=F4QJ76_9CAUL|nr:tryptophan halogenase family protein [Asticcacaulis biprosthecium]EGF91907.1 tryptophan halogenase PrnA [Asticcacaulis biprosthecium C19]
MSEHLIKNVVVLGGGTAGWLSAAMLAKTWGRSINLTVVESDDIGTVGVGEATIPPLTKLLMYLGIDENQFLSRVQGTFKLGIEFIDWYEKGQSYMHAFGAPGQALGILPFYQYWLVQKLRGHDINLWDYSLNTLAARQNRFARLKQVPNTSMEGIDYAFQFDAGLMAQFLRMGCENSGVKRIEGKVSGVNLRSEDGFIESLTLESGQVVEGEMFIDCSGFRGVLIEDALKAGYVNWQHWLPCDRAVAMPTTSVGPLKPYTQARAHGCGWQWRIPLQHRVGNGHVFCSQYLSDDDATKTLLDHVTGDALAEPRVLKFVTGRRKQSWVKNCLSLGLASGFMEPLESTSIHLVQSGMTRFLRLFPDRRFNPLEIAEYNRQTAHEYELIRDFLVLHYKSTTRNDTPFWDYCRTMEIPDTLAHKIEYFRQHGRLLIEDEDLFKETNWAQVLIGQGVMPGASAPLTGAIGEDDLSEFMTNLRIILDRTVSGMPDHAAFVKQNCPAVV